MYYQTGESDVRRTGFSDTAIQPFKQKEIIGIVNIKQFISELLLNQNNAFLEILDEGSEEITFPYIRQYDK